MQPCIRKPSPEELCKGSSTRKRLGAYNETTSSKVWRSTSQRADEDEFLSHRPQARKQTPRNLLQPRYTCNYPAPKSMLRGTLSLGWACWSTSLLILWYAPAIFNISEGLILAASPKSNECNCQSLVPGRKLVVELAV